MGMWYNTYPSQICCWFISMGSHYITFEYLILIWWIYCFKYKYLGYKWFRVFSPSPMVGVTILCHMLGLGHGVRIHYITIHWLGYHAFSHASNSPPPLQYLINEHLRENAFYIGVTSKSHCRKYMTTYIITKTCSIYPPSHPSLLPLLLYKCFLSLPLFMLCAFIGTSYCSLTT